MSGLIVLGPIIYLCVVLAIIGFFAGANRLNEDYDRRYQQWLKEQEERG